MELARQTARGWSLRRWMVVLAVIAVDLALMRRVLGSDYPFDPAVVPLIGYLQACALGAYRCREGIRKNWLCMLLGGLAVLALISGVRGRAREGLTLSGYSISREIDRRLGNWERVRRGAPGARAIVKLAAIAYRGLPPLVWATAGGYGAMWLHRRWQSSPRRTALP